MKKLSIRAMAMITAVFLVTLSLPLGLFTASAETGYSVEYKFIGDEAEVAGFAQGIITITPPENGTKSGYYLVYYTDGNKVLSDYDELVSAAITGYTVSAEIKDGLMIPETAKGIAVFESDTEFLDNAPDISAAVATASIPVSKQIALSDPELVFGLASDVHMNYEYYDRGAYEKWTVALDFFEDNGADYVFVAGDMTGDITDSNTMGEEYTLENQYKKYKELVDDSAYSTDTVFECIGNHGNRNDDLGLFTAYTSGGNEVHPYENSPYFYVLIEGKTSSAKDNLFIFMQQDLDDGSGGYVAGNSATRDNFTSAQIDWLEELLNTYGNDKNTNVFLFEHSPFLDYGAGDKFRGSYRALTTFDSSFPQNMRLKTLLETYKDVTVLSGHTHLTLYDNCNYSDMGNTFARTVHVGSTCWPRAYTPGTNYAPSGSDGRYTAGADYGSEAYLVRVYSDYTVYTGYNMSTGKIIPAACIIIPNKSYSALSPDEAFEGSGTASDPYLIQDEGDFLELTQGFNASVSETYGEGMYFKQTADIDMRGIEAYIGTHANGNAKCYFAGNYNGNGYSITVDINAPDQRSVFPYVYGVLYNVTIKGSITSDTTAQPIRTSHGKIINCFFDLDLDSETVHGVVFSNYTYLYNVYTRGTLNGTTLHAIASYDAADAVYGNVYHYYTDADGAAVADDYGTRSSDVAAIAAAFNNRTSDGYKDASSYITLGEIAYAAVQKGEIAFSKDGNAVYNNLLGGKTPVISGSGVGFWDEAGGGIKYRANLTDGVMSDGFNWVDNEWFGFYYNSYNPDMESLINAPGGKGTAQFALNGTYSLNGVAAHIWSGDGASGISDPVVSAYVSANNGKSWKPVSVSFNRAPDSETAYWAEVDLDGVVATDIKLQFDIKGYFAMVDEIEAYGTAYSGTNPEDDINIDGTKAILYNYLDTAGEWWIRAAFNQVEGNVYEVTAVNNRLGNSGTTALAVPENGFVLTVHNTCLNKELYDFVYGLAVGERYTVTGVDFEKSAVEVEKTFEKIEDTDVSDETSEPVEDETSEPIEDETSEPIEDETSEPIEDETSEPIEDETSEPIEDETSEPIEDETSEPVEDETSEPVEDETSEPVEDETSEPIEDETSEPKDETSELGDDVSDENSDDNSEPGNTDKEPEEINLGDVNENGEIDSLDYILLKRAFFNTFKLNEQQTLNGDINGNGEIDSLDYILLKRAYFGTYKIK